MAEIVDQRTLCKLVTIKPPHAFPLQEPKIEEPGEPQSYALAIPQTCMAVLTDLDPGHDYSSSIGWLTTYSIRRDICYRN
jgi:hypothetical protein